MRPSTEEIHIRKWILVLALSFLLGGCKEEATESTGSAPAGSGTPVTASTTGTPAPAQASGAVIPVLSGTAAEGDKQPVPKKTRTEPISREEAGLRQVPYCTLGAYKLDKRVETLLNAPEEYVNGDYQAGIVMDDSIVILGNKYTGSIAGDIRIGSSIEQVTVSLGEPSFREHGIRFYKTEQFYLGLTGESSIEWAVLGKTPDHSFPADILDQVYSELNGSPGSAGGTSDIRPEWGEFFEGMGHIHGGGWYWKSAAGVEVRDFDKEQLIKVYNDFAGGLYRNEQNGERFKYEYIDSDSYAEELYYQLTDYQYRNEQFAKKGVLSPSGKLTSIYEWVYSMLQYFTIRTVDGSAPDYEMHYSAERYAWLTDQYMVYIDFYDRSPVIIPVQKEQAEGYSLLEAIGYDQDFEVSALEVKDGVITLKQTDRQGKETAALSIQYQEDAAHNLQFKLLK
jgi:hypothetical protein